MASERLGKLPPRYSFGLNTYEETRFSRCPICDKKTHPRKFALFIVIDGWGPMALGKTCKFCSRCQLIIAHQDELEHELTIALEKHDPSVIGNEYMVFGTMERKVWQKHLKEDPGDFNDMLEHIADFEKEFDLHYEPPGWYPSDDE